MKGDAASQEEAIYGALLAHYATLQPEEVKERNAFEVADARQAMKLVGADYLGRFPKSDKVPEVKFNIARAYYEDGEFPKAAELFEAFALAHPKHKEATVAGNLALDALRQRNDFKGLEATGQKFLKSALPPEFRAQVQKILARSEAEALDELALESARPPATWSRAWSRSPPRHKGSEMGEKALYGAFTAAREKRDLPQERTHRRSSSSPTTPRAASSPTCCSRWASTPRRPRASRRPPVTSRPWASCWAATSPAWTATSPRAGCTWRSGTRLPQRGC